MKKIFLACFLACFAVCGATTSVSSPITTSAFSDGYIELPPLTEYLEVDAPETIYGKVGETIEISYGYRDIFSSSGFSYTPSFCCDVSIDYSEEVPDYRYSVTYNCITLIFNETGSYTVTASFSDNYNGAGGTVKKEFNITITDAEETTTTTQITTTTTTTEETTTSTTTTTETETATTTTEEETTTTTIEETTTTEEITTTTEELTTITATETTTTAEEEETTTTTTTIEELPETGYSKWYDIIALAATGMTITGTAFILRKKDDE